MKNISDPCALSIDFTSSAFQYRLRNLNQRNELIARAVGYRREPLFICDVTAGLGREAFLLAALGCNMMLFERHPIVANALRNALQKACSVRTLAPIVERITLFSSCAIEAMQQSSFYSPDVIYCDPMFSPRTKTAAVKKAMQQLHCVVGQDHDAAQLVVLARQHARKRVVVKRAIYDSPLLSEPDFSMSARSHRFDIYLTTP